MSATGSDVVVAIGYIVHHYSTVLRVVLPFHLTVDFSLGHVVVIGCFEVVPRSGVRVGIMCSLSLEYFVGLLCVTSFGIGVVFSDPIGIGSDRDSRWARVAGFPYPADG